MTPNDDGDGDIGSNNLQNYPVVSSAVSGSTSLNSTANTEFRIEFFANTACDPSGNGEGQTFLGFENVTTDGTGNVSFSTTVAVGQFITATTTDPAGNTSEFSECIEVTAGSTPTPTPTPTVTPTPPDPVGGIALEADAALRPLESPGSSGGSFGVLAWAIAAVAGAVALGGAALYTRKRLTG